MISPDQLHREISALEAQEPSWANLQRLSILYAIQSHGEPKRPTEVSYSRSAPPQTIVIPSPVPVAQEAPVQLPDTEFAQAAAGLTVPQIIQALDDHMEAIRAVYPAEYRMVMRRLQAKE